MFTRLHHPFFFFFFLEQIQVLSTHVGAQAAGDDHAEQHHDLLPPGLGLVLQSLLGVIGGPRGVLYSALHVVVYSVDHLTLKCSRSN